MYSAVQDFIAGDESREANWREWQYQVDHAARQVEARKNEFYRLRIVAVISAITVPSLVGLNLSGTGGEVVHWATFALSLVAAVSTAFVTLYRLGDRWLMYRALRDDLLKVGWDFVNCPPPHQQEGWEAFISGTGEAMARFNATYGSVIVGAAQSIENEKA